MILHKTHLLISRFGVRFPDGPPSAPFKHSHFPQVRLKSISGNFSPNFAFSILFCTQNAPKFLIGCKRSAARFRLSRPSLLAAISLLICLLFSGCASFDLRPDPWTRDQKIMQGTASLLNIIDWGQTLDIVDKPDQYYETNPYLGDHPSRGKVNRYFACSMAAKILTTHLLPSNLRKYWLGSNIMVSGYYVNNNYHIGLRVNF